MATFSASVNSWVAETKERVDAVFKASAQDVISEMQEVGPSLANPDSYGIGHMPVDTGFLWASLHAGLNHIPTETVFRNPDLDKKFTYDPKPVALVINGAESGDTIYATYGAEYAPVMEITYGFVRLAAQNWQQIVSRNAARAQQRAAANVAAAGGARG